MNLINEFVEKHGELPEESLKKFKDIFKIISYKKGETIASHKEKNSNFYLLRKGVVASLVTDLKGKEHIRSLFSSVSMVVSVPGIANHSLATAQYECLTDCDFYVTKFDQILALEKEDHAIALFFIRVLQDYYTASISRLNTLTVLDAKERYLFLKETNPNIESQIPLYKIASYLNITPIQLSRIRKDLVKPKKK